MLRLHKFSLGFTLIEIMISFALVGILVVIAVPAFQHWVQNAQIRNGAEGILNGLQQARGEAVRRNAIVQFTLTNQSGWAISTAATKTTPAAVILTRDAQEGSNNASVSTGGATTVSFNGMGWAIPNPDGSPGLSTIDVTSATMSADPSIRPLRVVILGGGSLKMCDPSPTLAAGDPRICP